MKSINNRHKFNKRTKKSKRIKRTKYGGATGNSNNDFLWPSNTNNNNTSPNTGSRASAKVTTAGWSFGGIHKILSSILPSGKSKKESNINQSWNEQEWGEVNVKNLNTKQPINNPNTRTNSERKQANVNKRVRNREKERYNEQFKIIYEAEVSSLFSPIITDTSYNLCNILLAVLNQLRGRNYENTEEYFNTDIDNSEYINLFVENTEIEIKKDNFENSGISRNSDLYTTYKNLIPPVLRYSLCDFDKDHKFIITSRSTKLNYSKIAADTIYDKHIIKFHNCWRTKDYIIGFINLYTKVPTSLGGIDHKNALIIDKKNKKIIIFEPKSLEFTDIFRHTIDGNTIINTILQRYSKTVPNEVSEDDIKSLKKIIDFDTVIIRGNQSTFVLSKKNDSIYCTVYSLYAALLFTFNYQILNKKLHKPKSKPKRKYLSKSKNNLTANLMEALQNNNSH